MKWTGLLTHIPLSKTQRRLAATETELPVGQLFNYAKSIVKQLNELLLWG